MWPFKRKWLHDSPVMLLAWVSPMFQIKIANFSKHITFCDILDPTAPWAMPSSSINRRSSSSRLILSSSLLICERSSWIAFISSVMLQNGHTSEYFGWQSVKFQSTLPGTTSFQGSSLLREGGRERIPRNEVVPKISEDICIPGSVLRFTCSWFAQMASSQ